MSVPCGKSGRTRIRIYTVGHTPVGTSGRNTAGQVADSLNTTGIYSVVRHPLYLGNFLMWLGIALLTCNIGFVTAFILGYWIYYERIMYAEEQFLRRKFGDTYLHWAEQTPAFLSRFNRFKPSGLPFSWKKVAKKKKTVCLLFSCYSACSILLLLGKASVCFCQFRSAGHDGCKRHRICGAEIYQETYEAS